MLQLSLSPDITPTEHLWDILDNTLPDKLQNTKLGNMFLEE